MGTQAGANFSLRNLVIRGGNKRDCYRCLGDNKVNIPAELQETLPVVWRSGEGNFDQKDRELLNFSRTWLFQRTGQDMPGAFC